MQGSFAGPAKEVNAANIARIRAEALATRPMMSTTAAEEEKKKEEKKKEGEDEHMEQDDAPVANKDKDATGGWTRVEALAQQLDKSPPPSESLSLMSLPRTL